VVKPEDSATDNQGGRRPAKIADVDLLEKGRKKRRRRRIDGFHGERRRPLNEAFCVTERKKEGEEKKNQKEAVQSHR